MSQIDEAFIQAYATPQPPTQAVVPGVPANPTQPPLAGLHHSPHLTLPASVEPQAANVETQAPAVEWSAEPLPAPHFRLSGAGQSAASVPASAVPTQSTQLSGQSVAAAPAETNERRPLSTFSAPEQPQTTAFHPVFEVDGFRWPKLTDDLLRNYQALLIPVAEQLLEMGERGRSLVGIAGSRPRIGCTTVQMCLARLLASTGKSIALVDGNFAKAGLARELGLEFDTGWEHVLAGELPLAECVVKSINDSMALLPLAKPSAEATELLASIHTSVTAGVLRYHYDLVLFNLGAASQGSQQATARNIMQHCRLDAGLIVADTASTDNLTAAQINPLMALFGPTCLGVIGNSAA